MTGEGAGREDRPEVEAYCPRPEGLVPESVNNRV
jgi:hypothetical protein